MRHFSRAATGTSACRVQSPCLFGEWFPRWRLARASERAAVLTVHPFVGVSEARYLPFDGDVQPHSWPLTTRLHDTACRWES